MRNKHLDLQLLGQSLWPLYLWKVLQPVQQYSQTPLLVHVKCQLQAVVFLPKPVLLLHLSSSVFLHRKIFNSTTLSIKKFYPAFLIIIIIKILITVYIILCIMYILIYFLIFHWYLTNNSHFFMSKHFTDHRLSKSLPTVIFL